MSADNRTGGAYAVIDGVLKQVEAPTVDHPEGNRPRDAEGRPTDIPAATAEVPSPAPADSTPAPEGRIAKFRRPNAEPPKE